MTDTTETIAEPCEAAAALLEARAAFFTRFDSFCEQSGRTRRNASERLFGSRRRVDELLAGADIGVTRLAKAESDLAAWAREAGVSLPAMGGSI